MRSRAQLPFQCDSRNAERSFAIQLPQVSTVLREISMLEVVRQATADLRTVV